MFKKIIKSFVKTHTFWKKLHFQIHKIKYIFFCTRDSTFGNIIITDTKFNKTYLSILKEINLNYSKILLNSLKNNLSLNISDFENWFNQLETKLNDIEPLDFPSEDIKKIGKNNLNL